MVITEIFKSIQGEGTRAGQPCIFVRLTGCNLRCTWCDTAYAFHGGQKMSVEEVVVRVEALRGSAVGAPLVELTGGEPLLQPDIYPLTDRLLAAGYVVLVETSGERFVGQLPKAVIKIVDVKCPDSGAPETFDKGNVEELTSSDEVKFVISSRRDYEFAIDFMLEHKLVGRVKEVLFSPVHEDPGARWKGLEPRQLVEWMLEDGVQARLGLQLHKIVWDPALRGV